MSKNPKKQRRTPDFISTKQKFRREGGILRTGEALRIGIHPRTLYTMAANGEIQRLSRGLYRLSEMPPLGNPDLVTVALKIPNGVISLISALDFHDLTTQIPHEVYIALPRGAEPPRMLHPPTRIFWFTGKAFTEGIQVKKVDGVSLRIYNAEKTLADCFKYRNKIGLETALEALRRYVGNKGARVDTLMSYARICRVEKVMRPYLEALM